VHWVERLTYNPVSSEFEPHQDSSCFLEQETLTSLLSMVGSSNGFESDFSIETKYGEGLMTDL